MTNLAVVYLPAGVTPVGIPVWKPPMGSAGILLMEGTHRRRSGVPPGASPVIAGFSISFDMLTAYQRRQPLPQSVDRPCGRIAVGPMPQ